MELPSKRVSENIFRSSRKLELSSRSSRKLELSFKMKKSIPRALREQVWLCVFGENFRNKCYISWCNNQIDVFNYECGHNVPESKGGKTSIDNLFPICRRCNSSMGNNYTIDEWNKEMFTKNSNELDKSSSKKEPKKIKKKEKNSTSWWNFLCCIRK